LNGAPLEKDIQRAILQYLEIKHIFHWRNNTGAYKADDDKDGASAPQVGKKKSRFIRFGKKGSSDIIGVLPGGRALFIEVKRPSGGSLSAAQKEFLGRARMAGALAFEARSVEEVDRQLREAMQ